MRLLMFKEMTGFKEPSLALKKKTKKNFKYLLNIRFLYLNFSPQSFSGPVDVHRFTTTLSFFEVKLTKRGDLRRNVYL